MALHQMTKTEARDWLKRLREDVRDAEIALKNNDLANLVEALMDAGGAAEHLRSCALGEIGTDCAGIRGMLPEKDED